MKELSEEEKAKILKNAMKTTKQGMPQQSQITTAALKNAVMMECECGGQIFLQGIVIKKISKILSPSGENMEIPIQIIYCKNCGKILPETDKEGIIPEKLKSKKIVSPKIKLS